MLCIGRAVDEILTEARKTPQWATYSMIYGLLTALPQEV
jgi:hypothetical protein